MKERSILWIFLAFILGFMLPVCSCVGMGFLTLITLNSMAASASAPSTAGFGDAVAVIRLDGSIGSASAGSFSSEGITPNGVRELLDRAAADPDIKAVVVRVNSPGGSVVASDEIYHALKDFEKPVVIWMDEMAASGGYYISCGADYVFAHPSTLTGSIGVISQFINAQELLDEVGVEVVVVTSGAHKDTGSLFREMTEDEQAHWQAISDEIYDGFVEIVAEERELPEEEVRELADGSVYTGRQALELGLVDELGTLDDAIAKAAELGGIVGEPRVVELETTPSFFEALFSFQAQPAVPTVEDILNWAMTPSVEFRSAGP